MRLAYERNDARTVQSFPSARYPQIPIVNRGVRGNDALRGPTCTNQTSERASECLGVLRGHAWDPDKQLWKSEREAFANGTIHTPRLASYLPDLSTLVHKAPRRATVDVISGPVGVPLAKRPRPSFGKPPHLRVFSSSILRIRVVCKSPPERARCPFSRLASSEGRSCRSDAARNLQRAIRRRRRGVPRSVRGRRQRREACFVRHVPAPATLQSRAHTVAANSPVPSLRRYHCQSFFVRAPRHRRTDCRSHAIAA